jgi:hypothetical protein
LEVVGVWNQEAQRSKGHWNQRGVGKGRGKEEMEKGCNEVDERERGGEQVVDVGEDERIFSIQKYQLTN